MKTHGWLVEDAVSMPAQPLAWFRSAPAARRFATAHGGGVRAMDATLTEAQGAPDTTSGWLVGAPGNVLAWLRDEALARAFAEENGAPVPRPMRTHVQPDTHAPQTPHAAVEASL